MQLNYRGMREADVYPAIRKWQDEIDSRMAKMEEADPQRLESLQITLQEELVAAWWKLADFIVMKYNDGKVNWPKAGVSIGYPEQFSRMIGFSNDVHPVWVQPAAVPPVQMDGYVPALLQCPLFGI